MKWVRCTLSKDKKKASSATQIIELNMDVEPLELEGSSAASAAVTVAPEGNPEDKAAANALAKALENAVQAQAKKSPAGEADDVLEKSIVLDMEQITGAGGTKTGTKKTVVGAKKEATTKIELADRTKGTTVAKTVEASEDERTENVPVSQKRSQEILGKLKIICNYFDDKLYSVYREFLLL